MIAMGTCKGYLTLRIICLTSTWPKGRILLFLLIEYCKVFETDGFHDSRNPSQIFCQLRRKKRRQNCKLEKAAILVVDSFRHFCERVQMSLLINN